MEEVMTIPMRVTEDSENLPMTLDMQMVVGGGAVDSVNGMTGDVVLTASDVGALPDSTAIPTKTSDLENDSGFLSSAVTTFNGQSGAVTYNAPVQSVNSKTGAVVLDASDVGAIAQETDPTVPSWAKQPNKPTYTASEVGALPSTTTIPTKTSDLQNDSGFLSTAVTSFNGQTGAVTYTAPVTSVNGATGAVVIGNATTSSAGLMSAQDKTDLGTLMADYSSALTALGVI